MMTESRAVTQNIRPLRVLILNLMPKKIETEIQLMRMLSNSPLQVDVDLLRIDDRESRTRPRHTWRTSITISSRCVATTTTA